MHGKSLDFPVVVTAVGRSVPMMLGVGVVSVYMAVIVVVFVVSLALVHSVGVVCLSLAAVVVGLVVSVVLEKLCYELVVIGYFLFDHVLALVQFLEQLVHVLGAELEMILNLLDPLLVHFLEVIPHQIPYLEVVQRAILIEVNLDDVCNQQ